MIWGVRDVLDFTGISLFLVFSGPLDATQAQADLASFGIDLEDLDFHFLAWFDHILWLFDLVISQFGDVEQTFEFGLPIPQTHQSW